MALLSTIGFVIAAIVILFIVIAYSVRLQRRAITTQESVVGDHFAEKAQRQRQLALTEEALELQRRADARAEALLEMERRADARSEEALQLSRRSVQLSEEILAALKHR